MSDNYKIFYPQDKESRLQKLKNQIKREIEEEENKLRKEKEGSIKYVHRYTGNGAGF